MSDNHNGFDDILMNLLNHSLDILCVFDLDAKFIYVNPAFTKHLGYSRDQVVNKSFIDFVHIDDVDSTNKAYDNLKKEQEVKFLKNRCKINGKEEYIWLSWTLIGKDGYVYSVARDITQEVEIKEKLDVAEKILLDGIADLKTLKKSNSYAAERLDKVIHNLHEISGNF